MPRGLFVKLPEQATIRSYEDEPLKDDEVRIRSTFAAVKHGTLFHIFSGKSPYTNRHFDTKMRIYVPTEGKPTVVNEEGLFLGNTTVGYITEAGKVVARYKIGDRVFCYGPACQTLTRRESDAELWHLKEPLSEYDAVCMDPAMFAYGAIRDGKPTVGDNVVVFGLGAIGLFVVQLLRLGGCMNIVAADPLPKRRELAEQYGATLTLDPTKSDVGLEIRRAFDQPGADLVIESSGHYAGLRQAIRSARQCGRVVALGYYKGNDTDLDLGAEWHHNRIQLLSSMPVWDNPMREYPAWNEARLQQTVLTMLGQRKLTSDGIVDPIVDFDQAADAFMDTYRNPSQAIKLGFRFKS